MWTSGVLLETGPGSGLELCSMVCEGMRLDIAEMMPELAVINYAINDMLVGDRIRSTSASPATVMPFPQNATSHRGGGFDLSTKDFFKDGTMYRVPHPLATSGDVNVAYKFWRKGLHSP